MNTTLISSAITQRSRPPGRELQLITINNNNTKNGNNKNVINNYTKITTTMKRRTWWGITNKNYYKKKHRQYNKNRAQLREHSCTREFVGANNNINNNSINIKNEWRTSNSMKAYVSHGLFCFSLWSCWWARSANTVCSFRPLQLAAHCTSL